MTLLRRLAEDEDRARCRVCGVDLDRYRADMGVCVDCVSRGTYHGHGLTGPRYGFSKTATG